MKSFTFTSSGDTRRVWFEGDESATQAVVWMDGGATGSGEAILGNVHNDSTLALGPDSLPAAGWMNRWSDPATPDKDVIMLHELPDEITSRFPTVQRIFIGGFSGGGQIIHEYMALRSSRYLAHGIANFTLNLLHTDPQGRMTAPIIPPTVYFYGTEDEHDFQAVPNINHSMPESHAAYIRTLHAKIIGRKREQFCGHELEISRFDKRLRIAADIGGTHVWRKCGLNGIDKVFKRLWAEMDSGFRL